MSKLKTVTALLALLFGISGLAAANPIVYNNGGPNQQNGNEMTEWIQTEDFTLGTAQTVTDVHFWDVEIQGAYYGSINWWITGDSAGNPDFTQQIASGTVTPTRVATGQHLFFGDEYSDSFNIAPLALGAGTYHLALHNGPVSNNTRQEFYWETTNLNATPTGRECDLGGACYASWFDNTQEHAFNLTGTNPVPEPGTLFLLGTGVLGMVRRRRVRSRV